MENLPVLPVEHLVSDPRSIERELLKVWREAAGGVSDRVKATLANTIIITSSEDFAAGKDELQRLLSQLSVAHPSRFFIVRVHPEDTKGTPLLKSSVSSRCVRAQSGALVCSEEIYLDVSPGRVPVVPNLLLSLLVADLDVIVVLLTNPGSNTCSLDPETTTPPGVEGVGSLLMGVEKISNRIIIDSARFTDFSSSMASVLQYAGLNSTELEQIARSSGPFKVRDLTWNGLTRWRSFIAEQFSSKRFSETASSITKIALDGAVVGSERNFSITAEGALLLGWLTARLDWKVVGRDVILDEGLKFIFKNRDGLERVCEVRGSAFASALRSCSICLSTNSGDVAVSLRRMFESDLLVSSTEFEGQPETTSDDQQTAVRRTLFRPEPLEVSIQPLVVSNTLDTEYTPALVQALALTCC